MDAIFDQAAFLERTMADPEIIEAVIESYFEDIPKQIELLKNALADRDAKKVQELAHRIRGASLNVSGLAIQSTAREMESAGANQDLTRAQALLPDMEKQFEELKQDMIESLSPMLKEIKP